MPGTRERVGLRSRDAGPLRQLNERIQMGLLKKVNKKPIRMAGGGGAQRSSERPQQIDKLPPCVENCPNCNDVRGWIALVAQHKKMGLSEQAAFEKAWGILVESNPFPSVMGRVCPHPCEAKCNRADKDGAVAINALERFLGDWGIEHGLALPGPGTESQPESIGIIGAGPAGLSCAYQLVRLGYSVTVYEAFPEAGGMLRYGIPRYRLPREVLDAEIQRILDLGVELKLNTAVGRDLTIEDLRSRHGAVFAGIGAHRGKRLGVPGEDGPGVWTGTEFLNRANSGEKIDVGDKVVVIGGGDTAVDAARVARRYGAEVTIVYRRTRTEMPAIDSEVEQAIEEGIEIVFLAAPVEVRRDGEKLKALVVQKMELGEPDSSGRRRPVPIEGSEYEIEVDTVVPAISQEPEAEGLTDLGAKGGWFQADPSGKVGEGVWAGGDDIELGLATIAIYQGRKAAESIHATLRDIPLPAPDSRPHVQPDRIKLDGYPDEPRAERAVMPPEQRLAEPDAEVDGGISKEQALTEAERCLSCGLCYGCEKCWMYCQASGFVKVEDPHPGHYYRIKLELCEGCKKCVEECPCGFLEMA
jgi:NADPH-dependent glutamate synthase beta subunit-like oxidoreductase/Pyruvate/2-oxoacid:ferredoxin oxidoreductase delta subunit